MSQAEKDSETGTPLPEEAADGGRLSEDRKLIYIDTIRGLAILLVITVHHSQQFALGIWNTVANYGQMGVQLFFLASAITLCNSIAVRTKERRPTINFFIRRIFRIAPLYYTGIIIYGSLDFFLRYTGARVGPSPYTFGNIISNVLFVHGFVPSAFNNIVPGGWSIATEMTFYAIFPALLVCVRAIQTRFGTAAVFWLSGGWLILDVVVQSLAERSGLKIDNNSILYCNIINQMPVFLIGIGAYYRYFVDKSAPFPTWLSALSFIVLSCAAWVSLLSGGVLGLALLPTLAGFAFFFLVDLARKSVTNSGPLERIGQVSFSIYIFHFLFAWQATRLLSNKAMPIIHSVPVVYVLTLAMSITAARI